MHTKEFLPKFIIKYFHIFSHMQDGNNDRGLPEITPTSGPRLPHPNQSQSRRYLDGIPQQAQELFTEGPPPQALGQHVDRRVAGLICFCDCKTFF